MEHGRLKREAFMTEIAQMAERIVRKAKEYDRETIPGDYATLATPCPNCGGVVKENYRRFVCTGSMAAVWPRTPAAAFPSPRFRAVAASSWPRWKPFLRDKQDRPAGGLPLQGRLALHRRAEAGLRRRDRPTGSWSSTSARTPSARANRASRWTSPSSKAWAPAPSARAMSMSTAPATSASTRSAPTSPAISRAARSSCSSRWRASR